jgi:hypothetical protein
METALETLIISGLNVEMEKPLEMLSISRLNAEMDITF